MFFREITFSTKPFSLDRRTITLYSSQSAVTQSTLVTDGAREKIHVKSRFNLIGRESSILPLIGSYTRFTKKKSNTSSHCWRSVLYKLHDLLSSKAKSRHVRLGNMQPWLRVKLTSRFSSISATCNVAMVHEKIEKFRLYS